MLVSSGGCRMARRPAAAAQRDMGRAAAGFKPAHADVRIRALPSPVQQRLDFRDRTRIPAPRRAARRPSGKGAAPSRGGLFDVRYSQLAGHQPWK